MRRTLKVLGVAVVGALLWAGVPGRLPTSGAATSGGDGGGTVSVGATNGGGSGGRPGLDGNPGGGGGGGATGGGSDLECTSTPLVLNDTGFPAGGPTPGGWYLVTCVNMVTGAETTETVWLTSATPAPSTPPVDPRALALQAEQSLRLPSPVPGFNPSSASVVNLPTWLWVDGGIWRTYSVSASAGTVSATAVATPTSVEWSMGDGGLTTCDGPGSSFDTNLPATAQSTGCSYTYLQSSAGQPSPDGDPDDGSFTVTATVTWAVSWSSVGAPGGGTLPDLTTTASVPMRVVQVESVDEDALVTVGVEARVPRRPASGMAGPIAAGLLTTGSPRSQALAAPASGAHHTDRWWR